jgi:hypothetical protein
MLRNHDGRNDDYRETASIYIFQQVAALKYDLIRATATREAYEREGRAGELNFRDAKEGVVAELEKTANALVAHLDEGSRLSLQMFATFLAAMKLSLEGGEPVDDDIRSWLKKEAIDWTRFGVFMTFVKDLDHHLASAVANIPELILGSQQ